MEIEILDKKIAEQKSWFLGKTSLWDYLSSVIPENFDFEIQRGIVKNRYLDSILQSINAGEVIPPITITASFDNYDGIETHINIDEGNFNILDGLQRTYRLWLYKKIAEIATSRRNLFGEAQYDIQDIVSTLKSKQYYMPGVLAISQIKALLETTAIVNVSRIEEIYKQFDIYLYVWSGLSEKEIIQKMLILNAGQRKVSIGHQYELMFLQIFKDRQLTPKVSLVREKEENYTQIKTGRRTVGVFIFSSTIIGIQSLIACKPIRLSPGNLDFGNEEDYISEDQVNRYFNQPFLNIYLESLYEIDNALVRKNETYLKWFVKDTTISGVMGAIGAFLKCSEEDFNSEYKKTTNLLISKIEKNDCFHIVQFYAEYSKLSSQKINIGDKVRNAIYNYTLALLTNKSMTWSEAFTNNKD